MAVKMQNFFVALLALGGLAGVLTPAFAAGPAVGKSPSTDLSTAPAKPVAQNLVGPPRPLLAPTPSDGAAAADKKAEKKVKTKPENGRRKGGKGKVTSNAEEAAGAVNEATKIEPYFTYRYASLKPDLKSAYHKEEHVDAVDQIYATLRFARTYDYVHNVIIEPAFRTLRNDPLHQEFLFEQAYIESEAIKDLSITAGKKTEYEGSGFVVNPSDLLNEDKDVFDTLYQREGKVFSRLRYRIGDFSLGLGYVPFRANPANKGKAWLSASGQIALIDIRLQAMEQKNDKTTTGLSLSRFFGEHVELHFDGRYQRRQRDPNDVGGVDYLDFSSYKHDDASGFFLGGSRFILSARRTVILESIQQQAGLLPAEFDRYFADVSTRNSIPDPPTILRGRHYGFVSYQDDESLKRTHMAVNYLTNTDDRSAFASATVSYSLSPITTIELTPTIFDGKRNSEFGEMPFDTATYLIFKGRF